MNNGDLVKKTITVFRSNKNITEVSTYGSLSDGKSDIYSDIDLIVKTDKPKKLLNLLPSVLTRIDDYYIALPEINNNSLQYINNPVYNDNGILINFTYMIKSNEEGNILLYNSLNDNGLIIGNIEMVVRKDITQSVIKFNTNDYGIVFPIDSEEVRFYFISKLKKFQCMRNQISKLNINTDLVWSL